MGRPPRRSLLHDRDIALRQETDPAQMRIADVSGLLLEVIAFNPAGESPHEQEDP